MVSRSLHPIAGCIHILRSGKRSTRKFAWPAPPRSISSASSLKSLFPSRDSHGAVDAGTTRLYWREKIARQRFFLTPDRDVCNLATALFVHCGRLFTFLEEEGVEPTKPCGGTGLAHRRPVAEDPFRQTS